MKTTEQGGVRGYDGEKKIKGRKRHIITDTQGFILSVNVGPANENDRSGIKAALDNMKAKYNSAIKLCRMD